MQFYPYFVFSDFDVHLAVFRFTAWVTTNMANGLSDCESCLTANGEGLDVGVASSSQVDTRCQKLHLPNLLHINLSKRPGDKRFAINYMWDLNPELSC